MKCNVHVSCLFFLQENDLSIGSLLGMGYTCSIVALCVCCVPVIIMFYTLWIDFLVSPEKDQNKTAPLPLSHVSCLLEILTYMYVQHVLFHPFNGRACDGMNVCYIQLQVDPTYRSLLEETSVDYIHKFRELASQMNTEQ